MAEYSEIVRGISSIPDYLSNDELRKIINVGIHDAMRFADTIKKNSSVIFDITVNEKVNNERILKCQTNFESGVHGDIAYTLVGRTVVEPNKQNDIVTKEITISN